MQELLSKLWVKVQELAVYLCQWAIIAFLAAGIGSHIFFWSTCVFLDDHTQNWLEERSPLSAIDQEVCTGLEPERIPSCTRLVEQTVVADKRAEHHFHIMRFYQVRYFALLSTAYWAGTLAAVLGLLVGKLGWDQADDRLRGLFLGLSMSTAFFGGFPNISKSQQNIDDNKKAYLAYDNLSTELRSYLVAHDRPEVAPEAFVHEVGGRLQDLNGIFFDVDASQVDSGRSRLMETTKEAQ